ncbi:MAG: alpha/beta hydrolase [Myxococcota bacterium]
MHSLPTPEPLADGISGRVQPGPGDAVLWLHGYTLDATSWAEMWRLLPGWHHIGIDLPGHGASEPLRADSDLIAVGDRLGELCHVYNVRHLVALSFGTIASLQLLMQQPGLLSSAVLGAPAIAGGPTEPSMATVYFQMTMLFRMAGRTDALTRLWMGSRAWRGVHSRPGLHDTLAAIVKRHRWDELSDPAKAAQLKEPAQAYEALEAIDTPLLLLLGEHEMPAFRQCADILEQRVASCRQVLLPDTDHLCMLQSPEPSALLIDEHLRAHATDVP